MKKLARAVAILALLPFLSGCATVTGTLVSPVTGGVDLARQDLSRHDYALAPPVFIAGMLAGPFVALYNGVNHDASIFQSWGDYWREFDKVFRPFETVRN